MAERISVLTASMYLGFSTVVLHSGMCVWKIQRNCDTAPFSMQLCTVDIYLFYNRTMLFSQPYQSQILVPGSV